MIDPLRQEIFNQITDYADALSDDEAISCDERDAYYEAATIALTGKVPE